MGHILVVEPDDDLCLFLRQAVCSTGRRPVITGSVAEAMCALDGGDRFDLVIANAVLPDGAGAALRRNVMRLAMPLLLLQSENGRIVVSDGRSSVFSGTRFSVIEFLKEQIEAFTSVGGASEIWCEQPA